MQNNRAIIFIINDYFGHGGHVKSFESQLKVIFKTLSNIKIVCAKDGYLFKNPEKFDYLDKTQVLYIDMQKLRKTNFSYSLYKSIKYILIDNAILHLYSYECYFSALLAKSYYSDVSIINSVMGGPNPFPLLGSTDMYIAVSKEQKDYALKYGYGNNINQSKILIIKNRIKANQDDKNKGNENKYVLVVSRFDTGMRPSLNNAANILKNLPAHISVKIAGTGTIIEEYKKLFDNHKNIEFLGYCKNINEIRKNAFVVLGMGRSILESLLYGKASILVGYKGIEILEDLETVSFASDYNFAGRNIKYNTSIDTAVKKILKYSEENFILNNSIIDFLNKEYSIKYFNNKYEKIITEIESQKTNKIQTLFEYLYIFTFRIKRKFIK